MKSARTPTSDEESQWMQNTYSKTMKINRNSNMDDDLSSFSNPNFLSISRNNNRTLKASPSATSSVHNFSFSLSPNPATENKDQFTIYSSVKKRRTERTDTSVINDGARYNMNQQTDFQSLPIKQDFVSSNLSENQAGLNSTGYFNSRMGSRPTTLSDLLRNDQQDEGSKDYPETEFINKQTQRGNFASPIQRNLMEPEESPITAEAQKQNFQSPTENEWPFELKSQESETKNLTKTIEKLKKKLLDCQNHNETLQKHIKDLLNDRKNLIKQIENSEFEEIIEEEEVQKANPNVIVKEEISKENFIDKTQLTIRDFPPNILNNYRKEIIDQEKEKMELETRSLLDSINFQWQQKYHQLKQEYETRQVPIKNISKQSHIQKKFHQTVLEYNLIRSTTPPVEITPIQPVLSAKSFANEPKEDTNITLAKETRQIFDKHIQRNRVSMTDWQSSILDRFNECLEENDPEKLSLLIRELLFRPSKSIATVIEPVTSEKVVQSLAVEEVNKTLSKELSNSLNTYIYQNKMNLTEWQTEKLKSLIKFIETKDSDSLSSVIQKILLRSTKNFGVNTEPIENNQKTEKEVAKEVHSEMAGKLSSTLQTYMKKSKITTTAYQSSLLNRFINAIELNNIENISSLLEELLFKPSRTISTNTTLEFSTRPTQTLTRHHFNANYDVNLVSQKPLSEKNSKSVSVRPTLSSKGCQPDEVFCFESGTMTDHLFYRSQGVMTTGDFSSSFSPAHSDVEGYVTRSSNRFEAKQEITSKYSVDTSSNIVENTFKKFEENTGKKKKPKTDISEEWEQTVMLKGVKKCNGKSSVIKQSSLFDSVDNSGEKIEVKRIEKVLESKPKRIIEEYEQKIEENQFVLTAHVDKDQKVKENTETTVECWETVSKIKDGQLIEKKESHRDKFVSSNPDEIRKHIESHSHEHQHSEEISPIFEKFSKVPSKTESVSVTSSQNKTEEFTPSMTSQFKEIQNYKMSSFTDAPQKSFSFESNKIPINVKTSTAIPVIKRTTENSLSNIQSPLKFSFKDQSDTSRNETRMIDEFWESEIKDDVSMTERIQSSSVSKTFNSPMEMQNVNSPISFTNFSSRTTSSSLKSDSSIGKLDNTYTKPNILPKPKITPSPLAVHSTDKREKEMNYSLPPSSFSESVFEGKINSTMVVSQNSAFHSLSDQSKPVLSNEQSGNYEVLLPENIFQLSNQVLLFMNKNKHVRVNVLESWPAELVESCKILIDWWVDMVNNKLEASQLMTTIKYLIGTFSKNFVKFLITNKDQQGNTCTHYIVGHQRWESFSVLFSTGLVDPNLYNSQGFTIMMLAAIQQVPDDLLNTHIRKLITSADLNLQSKEQGQTAIFLAALHNCDNIISALFSMGADINLRDKNDNTPLIIASSMNNIEAVRVILSCAGVLTELKNRDGKTALDIAKESNYSEIISMFEQRKSLRYSEYSSIGNFSPVSSPPLSPRFQRRY